jgi:hypothetical protein
LRCAKGTRELLPSATVAEYARALFVMIMADTTVPEAHHALGEVMKCEHFSAVVAGWWCAIHIKV